MQVNHVSHGAEEVRWDLASLFQSTEEVEEALDRAETLATQFELRYRGTLGALAPGELSQALDELGELQDLLGRVATYAFLQWVTATEDPARGALLQRVQERHTDIGKKVIFFEVEWAAQPGERVRQILQEGSLARARHYLEVLWLRREHLLTEPEEKVIAEKQVTGRAAWNRFFDELLGAARFELDGEMVPEQTVLAKLHAPDRATRRAAALSLTYGLERLSRPLTFVFNTLLAEKASDDRLRGYPHWLASRNLDNETSDAAVQALVEAVASRYDLSERYYLLKARLLGLEGEMMDYDRYAPLGDADREYTWGEARDTVLDAFGAFHDDLQAIALRFFEERWIDAPVLPGKRGGAFSHGAVPSAHPFIMLNFTGRVRDVQTLAHELGHGVHQYLSRDQGIFHADTPLTTAETASVFAEMLVFERLLAQESDPKNRLAMLVQKIDDTMATVFRQIAMNRFEERIHTHRREVGELSPDDFAQHWIETQRPMFGSALTLGEHYNRWWSYIPHFVHSPGYVYAYAFGELLVLALYARYQNGQERFEDGYIELLRSGGSDWPHVLVGELGIDLRDPDFWGMGLSAIDELITKAEQTAGLAGARDGH